LKAVVNADVKDIGVKDAGVKDSGVKDAGVKDSVMRALKKRKSDLSEGFYF